MSGTIGISGMGRIGRLLLRRFFSAQRTKTGYRTAVGDDAGETAGRVKAINSIYPAETVAHLLKYDTIHGTLDAEIKAQDGRLWINGQEIEVVCERDPQQIPWKQLGIDVVVDATGKFNDRQGAERHRTAGASVVIVTAPAKQMDLTVVMGVNDDRYDPDRHALLSAASCTTNCVAPVLHILDGAFRVTGGWATTIHAYTNDQNHLDNPHSDLRRARACGQSIIPTTTGVGKALADVLPRLAPLIQGLSVRVPTPDVSLLDLTVQVEQSTTVGRLREVLRTASEGALSPYVGYCEEPLVSADFIGCDKSAVIDGLSLQAHGTQIKVLAWYDNEWAYACRVADLVRLVLHKRFTERGERVWEGQAVR